MNRQIRNIILFAFISAGGGWLGIWVNHIMGNTNPPMESPGVLVWLVSPALAGLLLRALGKDGWRDAGFGLRLRKGWRWYLLAIPVYPLIAILTATMAIGIGAVSTDGFASRGVEAYFLVAAATFAGSMMKNIFEEFAWRGYLTPRLDALKIHPMVNHLIVGIVWWSWHLPYYAYFLDRTVLENYIASGLSVFIMNGLLVLFPTAILFGELRLVSKSVWPVYLLHCTINGLSMPLIANGFIRLHGVMGSIFSPGNEGFIPSILFGFVGLGLYRYRRVKAKQSDFP